MRDNHSMTDEGRLTGLRRVSRADVTARQQANAPSDPVPNPRLLPFAQLDPGVFERVVVEIVDHQDNHGVQLYGRSGQIQHGLDIVEYGRHSTVVLYQVKRYQNITPSQLREAVETYAGPPRPIEFSGPPRLFNPQRFVVVTSAELDRDTATVDTLAALRAAYAGDFEIEAWGAETLGRKLRDAPRLVYAVFGSAWAQAWCGFTPTATDHPAPRPLGFVEDPVEVLGLAQVEADARLATENGDPAATGLYGSIAQALHDGGFAGHAEVMRMRQAAAAQAVGEHDLAFSIRFDLALRHVLGSESPGSATGRYRLAEPEHPLDDLQAAKLTVLTGMAEWVDQGSDLPAVVPALERIVDAEDPHAAILCCRVIEQALADGLYDFVPARSVVADVDDTTTALLTRLRELCATVNTADVVLRARLRCAVADAALSLDSPPDELARAYDDLVDAAMAGRFQHARGLVVSRAAYAHAVRGAAQRAANLWRASMLVSSEERFYGDVRMAARSLRYLITDNGELDPHQTDVYAITQALPNDHRLLNVRVNPALIAYAAAHAGKVVDAFGDTRHYLLLSRTAGHLHEEHLALDLFGDVLDAAKEPRAAVHCYVAAGRAEKAAQLARELPELVDVTPWLTSAQRRNQSAAVHVLAAQARLIHDDAVDTAVTTLLDIARRPWKSTHPSPTPALDALDALLTFGDRLPESAVDPILELAQPVLTGARNEPFTIVHLLVAAYRAVASRREDVANAISTVMRSPFADFEFWRMLKSLPESICQPLLATTTSLADEGHQEAIAVLTVWDPAAPAVQLAARRACAALLRKPYGHARTTTSMNAQEYIDTVRMLNSLLDAPEAHSVDPRQLEQPVPTGASDSPARSGTAPTVESGSSVMPPDRIDDSEAPDDASALASGPASTLAIAVARKLLIHAEDHHDSGASRAGILMALRPLLSRIPPAVAADLVPRLYAIHLDPHLSETDQREIDSDVPLSRARFNTPAARLSSHALVAAAEAFAASRDKHFPLTEHEEQFTQKVIAAAAELLRRDGIHARLGAHTIVALATSAAKYGDFATGLLLHTDDQVRAIGARRAPVSPEMFRTLAKDPALPVRLAVAQRHRELPNDVRTALAADNNALVRRHINRRSQNHP